MKKVKLVIEWQVKLLLLIIGLGLWFSIFLKISPREVIAYNNSEVVDVNIKYIDGRFIEVAEPFRVKIVR